MSPIEKFILILLLIFLVTYIYLNITENDDGDA